MDLDDNGKKFKDVFPQWNISGKVQKLGDQAYSLNGGFADVWLGQFNGELVAIKALRVPLVSSSNPEDEKNSIRVTIPRA